MHNFVQRLGKEVTCSQEQYCILYSGDMTATQVVAGTVFRSILIWSIDSGDLTKKLEGH